MANSGVWSGWDSFYGSGSYTLTGDVLKTTTPSGNRSALLYCRIPARPGERFELEVDARCISGKGRITAITPWGGPGLNSMYVRNHSDFRRYKMAFTVPPTGSGVQDIFIGLGQYKTDNTGAASEMEFIVRGLRRSDALMDMLVRPATYGLLSPETRAIISAMPSEPVSTLTNAIEALVAGMKTAGIWDQLDAFYMLAAGSESLACINWRSPGLYTLVPTSSPTFTANSGYSSVNGVGYLSTLFNAYQLSDSEGDEIWTAKLTQNSNTMFMYITDTGGIDDSYVMGTRRHTLGAFGATGRFYARNGPEAGVYVSGFSQTTALYATNRSTSTDVKFFRNGVLLGTAAQTSVGPFNENVHILKRAGSADTCGNNIIRCAGFGGSLSDAQHATLYNLIKAYATAALGLSEL